MLAVSIVSLPPSGMASRAFTARLSKRALQLVRIGHGAPQAAGQHRLDHHRFAQRATQQFRHAGDQLVGVERHAGPAPGAARRPAAAASASRRAARPGRSCAARGGCAARWRQPAAAGAAACPRRRRSTVSRLLKSCAMPPVSWPTASIFCAWRERFFRMRAALGLGLQRAAWRFRAWPPARPPGTARPGHASRECRASAAAPSCATRSRSPNRGARPPPIAG